jgi:polar amino acid transport system substrate-binding protein
MDADVVREALKLMGFSLSLEFVPLARVPASVQQGTVDLAFPITEASGLKDVYYSDSEMTYENVAITLKKSGIQLLQVKDLAGRSIVAFQDATVYLGSDFKGAAIASPSYQEIADQALQVKMLFAGRVDVIVMDVNIFKYFRQRLSGVDASQEVAIYRVFAPSLYKVAFRSKAQRDAFNIALKKLRDSGRYEEIIRTYVR